jgi:HTH-type transcriptional regulator, sugar sensing transcriptional regulator
MTTSGWERAIGLLQELGLSGYESKAYVSLIAAARPLNGYEVSKQSGVPRSTIYETLAKLVARGAAFEVKQAGGGTYYIALPAESLLGRMRRDFDESFSHLSRSLKGLSAPPSTDLIHNLRGADVVWERARDVIESAEAELYLSLWPEDAAVLDAGLQRAEDRRIDIFQMAFGTEQKRYGHTVFHQFSDPTTVLTRVGCRLAVVAADRRSVLIAGTVGAHTWGVFTDDPAVVLIAVEFVRHDLAQQLIVDHFGLDAVNAFWQSNPAFVSLGTGRGAPGLALRRLGEDQGSILRASDKIVREGSRLRSRERGTAIAIKRSRS